MVSLDVLDWQHPYDATRRSATLRCRAETEIGECVAVGDAGGSGSSRVAVHAPRTTDARRALVAATRAFGLDAVDVADHGEEAPRVVAQGLDEARAVEPMALESNGDRGGDCHRLLGPDRLGCKAYDLHVVIEVDR